MEGAKIQTSKSPVELIPSHIELFNKGTLEEILLSGNLIQSLLKQPITAKLHIAGNVPQR